MEAPEDGHEGLNWAGEKRRIGAGGGGTGGGCMSGGRTRASWGQLPARAPQPQVLPEAGCLLSLPLPPSCPPASLPPGALRRNSFTPFRTLWLLKQECGISDIF